MEFLVQMRQSNKCGSARNDEILNLHLGSGVGLESVYPASCKIPATFIVVQSELSLKTVSCDFLVRSNSYTFLESLLT